MKRLLVLILCANPLGSFAAEPMFDAAAAADNLKPFLDENTLFLARLDVEKLSLGTAVTRIEPMGVIDALQKKLQDAGVHEAYVVYGFADLPQPPCLLLPTEPKPDLDTVLKAVDTVYPGARPTHAALHGFFGIGTPQAIERLKQITPVARPDLVKAFIATSADATLQFVFTPSANMRKTFAELTPRLPPDLGGGSIEIFTKGLEWIGLTLSPMPRAQLRVTVHAANGDAAKEIESTIIRAFELGEHLFDGENRDDRSANQQLYRRLSRLLTPVRRENELTMTVGLDIAAAEIHNLMEKSQPAHRLLTMNNLKQLGLALHSYHESFGRFPTDVKDKQGKSLLSWRVRILPFVDQQALYQQFKLDEPWDSEHNKKLIEKMPAVYRGPREADRLKGRTTYLAPLGKGLMWDDPKGTRIQDVVDGTSSTILLVEADDEHAVIWSKPDDIVIDKKQPAKDLLGHGQDGFYALFADGSVRLIAKNYSAIWEMFTKAGGEVLPEK